MNGKAPLTALLSKLRSEEVDDPINLGRSATLVTTSVARAKETLPLVGQTSLEPVKTLRYAGTPLEPEALTMEENSGLGDHAGNHTDVAWVAGIIDGEGCFSIPTFREGRGIFYKPMMRLTNTHKATIERVAEILAAHNVPRYVTSNIPRTSRHKDNYVIVILGYKRLKRFLDVVMPFLFTKRAQAMLIAEWIELRKDVIGGHAPYGVREKQIIDEMRTLNRVGSSETHEQRIRRIRVRDNAMLNGTRSEEQQRRVEAVVG